jgi:phosphoserine phosphatase RsbU/P
LLSIENELAIAHEIQTSILPSGSPETENLSISVAYRPMTAVAGDFYDFLPVDHTASESSSPMCQATASLPP